MSSAQVHVERSQKCVFIKPVAIRVCVCVCVSFNGIGSGQGESSRDYSR